MATTEGGSTTVGLSDQTTDSEIKTETSPELLMSPISFTIFGSVMTMYCITAILFDGCAMLVFFKNKNLRSPTNLFILGLNVCDFLMATIAAPLSGISSFYHRWLFGTIGCTYEGFAVYFLGQTSMYLLAAISFDRYYVIAKPLQASKITHQVAGISVLACYAGGFFWAFVPLVGWNEYHLEGAKISCSVVWESSNPVYTSYIFTIFVTCLVIPLAIMFFSYFNVYMTIKSINKNQVWDMKSRIARRNFRIEKKMFKTILAMCTTFVAAWMPYTVVSFYGAFYGQGSVAPALGTMPALVAKCAGLLNPIIYVATNKQFRTAFYRLVPCQGLRASLVKAEEAPDSDDDDDDEETKKGAATETQTQAGSSSKTKGGNTVAPAPLTDVVENEGETQIEEIVHTPTKHTVITVSSKVESVEMKEMPIVE